MITLGILITLSTLIILIILLIYGLIITTNKYIKLKSKHLDLLIENIQLKFKIDNLSIIKNNKNEK